MTQPRKGERPVSNEDMRKALEDDVQAYLARGKKIEQVPTGFSRQNPLDGRRQIIIGPSRKT